jgi:hypothetical protein
MMAASCICDFSYDDFKLISELSIFFYTRTFRNQKIYM